MQVSVVMIDPDLDLMDDPDSEFVARPAEILLGSTVVTEAKSVARAYRNYRYDVSIVHVVANHKAGGRWECRCGLVVPDRFAFQIHERPWSFRERKYGNHVPMPRRGPDKWHRLCSRCVP